MILTGTGSNVELRKKLVNNQTSWEQERLARRTEAKMKARKFLESLYLMPSGKEKVIEEPVDEVKIIEEVDKDSLIPSFLENHFDRQRLQNWGHL